MRHDWSWKAATKCFAVGLLVFGLTVGLAPVVGAITINFVDGTWQNDEPLGAATIDNGTFITDTRTARWGIPADTFQSGYNWTNASTPFVASTDGTPFSLGTFNHLNFPITGTAIKSIELAFSITIDGFLPLLGTFLFSHNETPNVPPNPEDVVTISSPLTSNTAIDGHYFRILGFSQDGGSTIVTQFITNEDGENIANLYGAITPIPEPATMLLLGSGLIGLAGFARRRFKR